MGVSCFFGCSKLTSITINSNSITILPGEFVKNCSSLSSFTIPENVTSLGDSCFFGCSSLTSITIPLSVTTLENNCFYACSSLTSITINSNRITRLGVNFARECIKLTSINIPTSVTSFGNSCFSLCSSLESITIPTSVTTLGDGCFGSCSSLTSITIPVSVTTLGDSCFYACNKLTSITINSNSITRLGDDFARICNSLFSITIPNSVTSLGSASFYGCSSLESITIPENVTTLGNYNFALCNSLKNFIFNNQNALTTIGTNTYDSCQALTVTYYNTADYNSLSDASKSLQDTQMPANSTYDYYPQPSCYNEGTKILCLNENFQEEYIPIEKLRKGILVKSYLHGYRRIHLIGKNKMINSASNFCHCMYKMKKTEENELLEDLIILGGHSILVDDLGEYKEENDKIFGGETQKIDDKYLLLSCLSKDFIKLENSDIYTYYHFILENNGNDEERFGVWANGILSETPSKNYFIKTKYIMIN